SSSQICGAPGDRSCKHASCGGALCRDSAGTRHCGGIGCAGALPVSARALSSAHNASQQLEVALGQLGVVAQKSARDAIQAAENRAREVRSMVWGSGAGTAGSNGISAVENKIDALGTSWVGRLVLGKCGWHWQVAGTGRCQGSEAGTMGMVVAVAAAAGVHTYQAERRLRALDRKESQAQRRLRELAQGITALQEHSQDARHMAQQAKERAQLATTTSGMLSQDLAHVTQRYVVLKNRVGVLDRVSGGALQRVSQLMSEAKDLLNKASNSKRKLEDLEQRFGANERTMAAKVIRLQALEQQVSGLLQEIRERANAYATC
ncbi:LAMB2 protein, partial [Spelaeornis formosus]|nr:LAMB2 protein [Elachura formosa]